MQPRKIICQGDNHKNNRENFNVENLPQSEKRKKTMGPLSESTQISTIII